MKARLIFFAVAVAIIIIFLIFDRAISNDYNKQFISQWSTSLVGTVMKTDHIESNSGIIYIDIDTITGPTYDVEDYKGGPFYLLTSNDKAKLVEGGLSVIKEQDLVVIDDSGTFLVLREGNLIINKKIFLGDFAPFWERVNENSVRSHWNW